MHLFGAAVRARDDWMRRQSSLIPNGARVLDVGAGQCRYRDLFSHCEYKTQDFAQLDPAATGWGNYGQIDYVSDITSIPVAAGSFDVVVCTEVLEHVPEPIPAIVEIARILRPGGTLLLSAPQRSGAHQMPFHFYGGFTREWYRRFLPANSLEIVSLEANGGFFHQYAEESQRFVTMILPAGRHSPVWQLPLYSVLKFRAAAITAVCKWLDRFDTDRGFTVGYHVVARKLKR